MACRQNRNAGNTTLELRKRGIVLPRDNGKRVLSALEAGKRTVAVRHCHFIRKVGLMRQQQRLRARILPRRQQNFEH